MKPYETTVVDRHIAFIAKLYILCNMWLGESSRAPVLWWTTTYDLLRAVVELRLAKFTEENWH